MKPSRFNLFARFSKYYSRHRKRVVRYGLVAGNLLVVLTAVLIVNSSRGGQAVNFSAVNTLEETTVSNPLDKITATDVAAEVARMTALPELEIIDNDAARARATIESATPLDQSVAVLLPQVLSGDIKTKEDIKQHTVKEGDTLDTLASKFGVTSNSIRWSNGLSSSRLRVGTKLIIPPVNGIAYKVKAGDNAKKLASKYHASERDIITFNDAEVDGLKVGELIVIPGGEIRVVASLSGNYSFRRFSFSRNITHLRNYWDVPLSRWYIRGRGTCTHWASFRAGQFGIPVGNWGNARDWANSAKRDGRHVSSRPKKGAIMQTSRGGGGYGHVAVVEEVSPDGTMVKYSDMNGLAGYGNAAMTNDWVPAAGYNYIY